ncbi:hypothetical protein TREMEDRAFT_70798 [Tremella mesenterica DSM 1558]|uniref:uncharacterized protein n=1 Tax=Tremella mesenterica (strain ATCC 24925 / CBS 8224 / DSM 1558 / NBRC 9311 / NRRL Y-6157 / RJB 2259-6 / UBC 559-6) TaxID=578456 RepID=UPI0003F4A5A7|nr:uncharacterized protein TREMEDRAFT_70798 [Tremella mesenterica DSM 1558]EIW72720.1 hypothetical protein TREMEDRAFT_70798 [Tremella mesenterica DSM 1558]
MAANVLAVASNLSSLFGKSSSLSSYTLHSSAPSPASSSSHLPSTSALSSKPLTVGLWKVVGATHNSTSKDVSVWVFEKKILDGIRGDSSGRTTHAAREWVIEQLKKEATSLGRLRHPDILHMVEPLEETRSELTFVTEVVTSSLGILLSAVSGSSKRQNGQSRPPGMEGTEEVDLDEVEIQKGTLQIAKGLRFLHQQARMVHLNLSPEAILINSKGDWKLSGLGLTTPLTQPDGSATKYVYPEGDGRLPPQVQWKLDYLAPEYALDATLTPASDLYSLGCVLYAVHMGGKPPFQNRGSMQSLRENAEGSLIRRDWASGSRWERQSSELKDLLPRLLTRQPSTRISLASLPSHPFFSSLAINTLNFLDPTTFASKPREEKATFLRGLVRVLPNFSDRLRKGKILPSLLDEMKDSYLLPFLLPNVFEISRSLTKDEFTSVLPKLKPLFALKDPPQNMMTLLEHLSLFEEKTNPPIFREHVMPLIYNSLECEHLPVQEKALKAVPHLCEVLDYSTVQNVLLVKVAILFTRTRILSVKVQTLECFEAMVKTLDKATLTTKLVPLLAKIKTKVHAAMGAKVDREAIATLVLPQLWAMSMGPLLNAEQFGRFMQVIKSLGNRVESEHMQHLRDVRRIEQQTASFNTDISIGTDPFATNGFNSGEMDFESLVKGSSTPTISEPQVQVTDPWNDNSWLNGTSDSSLSNEFNAILQPLSSTTFPSTSNNTSPVRSPALPSPRGGGSSKLKARPVPSSAFNTSAFESIPTLAPPTLSSPPVPSAQPSMSTPSYSPFQSIQPDPKPATHNLRQISGNKPNYNISLDPQIPAIQSSNTLSPPRMTSSFSTPSIQPMQSLQTLQPQSTTTFSSSVQSQNSTPQSTQSAQPTVKPPPGWTPGLMQPTLVPKTVQPALGKMNWDDFDPLK